jgi:hypothetical protein
MTNKRKFLISIDVEQDISTYIKNSYKGIEYGLPPFLDLLDELKIKADFFVNADVCKRYPHIVKRIVDNGHTVGSHGFYHEELLLKSYTKQLYEISKSTELIEKLTGVRPKMFRAPSFTVTANTLKVLQKLDYLVDSSVMPGTLQRIRGILPIKSFKKAPRIPYHPSSKDVAKIGDMNLVEVPLTENPIFRGTPFGAGGGLNLCGMERMIAASEKISEDYIIFLVHPWELVDLGMYHPELKDWIKKICSDDIEKFKLFFMDINKKFDFGTIYDICKI